MPPGAPGEESWAALALVNSRHAGGQGVIDELATPEMAAEWLRRRRLLPSGAVLGEGEAERVRGVRSVVRAMFRARIDRVVPDPAVLDSLTVALRGSPGAPGLRWTAAEGPSREWLPLGGSPIDGACGALARDAVDLLCGQAGRALAACAAPGCVRLLLKDHPRRRWCSTGCGDRVRSARYYRRHRARLAGY